MSEKEKYIILIDALKLLGEEILPEGSELALYGSRARNDYNSESDWDLHILIPGNEKLSLAFWNKYAWPFADKGLEFGEIVNPRLYSYSGWEKRSFLPFYKNVERDKIILLRK